MPLSVTLAPDDVLQAACDFWLSTAREVLGNLREAGPCDQAREFFYSVCETIQTATDDDRPAFKELLPFAEAIRDEARELML